MAQRRNARRRGSDSPGDFMAPQCPGVLAECQSRDKAITFPTLVRTTVMSLTRHLAFAIALALPAGFAVAAQPFTPPPLAISRTTGPIVIDGDLSDPAWKDAVPIERWWETNPGDNIEPSVRNVGRLAYDDKYLYAAFEFDDPEPAKIRAPYADRDNVDSSTDYGGIILDPDNDRKTATLFLANPRGIQYDALNSDTNGNEDNAPDWFWESAAKINAKGWTLEIRIPFSSLRYPKGNPQTWGVMLYRNRPRDRRYQIFTTRLPRDSNCFICNEQSLTGLSDLPPGGNWVIAPYGVARQESTPRGELGTELVNPAPTYDAGLDAKWTPNAGTTIDLTANPDFSQIESDVAQITANERFALFYPEKRPFFLEGVDLLSTPVQAVYTRTITAPTWGARATGKAGDTSYTALVSNDDGGGSVIIPGPDGSDFAPQDFHSTVAIGRVRHDLGQSFVSGLFTDREIAGGGHNRVIGPDFQWRPKKGEALTGQILYSDTRTPDLHCPTPGTCFPEEWDGRSMSSHAAELWYQHNDAHWDAFMNYRDYGDGFRAYDGFVPQVGFREGYFEGGYSRYPEKQFISRQRVFLQADYVEDRPGALIQTFISPGTGMDGRANSFMRFWIIEGRIRATDALTGEQTILPQRKFRTQLQASPWHWLTRVNLEGAYGRDVDFVRARTGHGGQITFSATVRPTDHLAIDLLADERWLDVETGTAEARLFTAKVERIKATYTFTSRCFLRLIAQRQAQSQDAALYGFVPPIPPKDEATTASALFAYKLNWQSVLYFGYGNNQLWSPDTNDLERANQSFFLKLSYAFQR